MKTLSYQSLFVVPGPPIEQPPHEAAFRSVGTTEFVRLAPPRKVAAAILPPLSIGASNVMSTCVFDSYVFDPNVFSACPPFVPWQYDQAIQITHPHPKHPAGAVAPWSNIDAKFERFYPYGWPIQPPQPPHPRPERFGALAPWLNIDAKFEQFYPHGWPIQPPQPPHPRPEKYGALARGDDGTQSRFINFFAFGWPIQPPQPPHPRPERSAAIMRGDDGTQSRFINFFAFGWPIQPPQPPHPRPERAGAIMPKEDGTEAKFILVPVGVPSWEFITQNWQPPHPRPERSGAWMLGDWGVYAPFVPPVPPRRAATGNIMRGVMRGIIRDITYGPMGPFNPNTDPVLPGDD